MKCLKDNRMGICFLGILVSLLVSDARGQVTVRPLAGNVIVPQSRIRAFSVAPERNVITITDVNVQVDILDKVATTTIDIGLKNNSRSRQEAELIMPVPDGAVVRGFTFQGAGKEPIAQILAKEEARRIYNRIVSKMRDPALLEFVGYNLVRSSVFPVEPNGTQKVRLTYEHIMASDGKRHDYILPRSEMLQYKLPWKITVNIRSTQLIASVYSPSHELDIKHKSDKKATVTLKKNALDQPGPFRLSYLTSEHGVTASFYCYPDPKVGGGYFLLLGGVPAPKEVSQKSAIKREVTVVIDKSGSMNGEKIEQVKEASRQILAGLKDGEMFNIIVYSNTVEMFARQPVVMNRQNERAARNYIMGIRANGGTNIHDALVEALRQKSTEGMLSMVLFLTDGLPTVGRTSEKSIREAAVKANSDKRRIFTLGVGVDVNAPLLDRIATESRATSTYVLPKEDVEVKVGQLFKKLSGPILAGPEWEVVQADGREALGRVREVIPAKLPDVFADDQMVLLGQYVGKQPLTFLIRGNYLGEKKAFRFSFDFDQATTRNAFVPRLWASRKIAQLIDAVRQLGANGTADTSDPKVKELVDEIVRLSTEYGILTEYTAFLAREGTNLGDMPALSRATRENLDRRAVGTRSGMGAVSQSYNFKRMSQKAASLNYRNEFYDGEMKRVTISNVQQVNDRAFYRKGNRWIDSRVVNSSKESAPDETIDFDSPEFQQLVVRLVQQNRQGSISLRGDILLDVDGKVVLVKGPGQ